MFHGINEYEASARFVHGETIYMCACNLRPELFACGINKDSFDEVDLKLAHDSYYRLFDKAVNEVSHYNCLDSETGRKLAFYFKEG